MLSSLPCNYKGLWSWVLSRKRMCQVIWLWIQQSITHQQWHEHKHRQSSVNRSTAAHPFTVTHTLSSNTITDLLTHCTYTENTQTCEDPEFSKCLTANSLGANTTSGHMMQGKPTNPKVRILPSKSNIAKCVCKVYLEFRTLLASIPKTKTKLNEWLQQQKTHYATHKCTKSIIY